MLAIGIPTINEADNIEDLTKKIASGTVLLVMALSVIMTAPFYSDSQPDVQDVSPLEYLDPKKPAEN